MWFPRPLRVTLSRQVDQVLRPALTYGAAFGPTIRPGDTARGGSGGLGTPTGLDDSGTPPSGGAVDAGVGGAGGTTDGLGGAGGSTPPPVGCESFQCYNGRVGFGSGCPGPFVTCDPATSGGVQCVRSGACPSDADDAGDAGSCTAVDITSNPLSCGACGAVCKPKILATVASFYYAVIATDERSIYFSGDSEDGIWKMPLAGGVKVTLVTESASSISTMAVDATRVYWSIDDYSTAPLTSVIKAVSIDGGNPTTLVTVPRVESNLVVHGGNLYWNSLDTRASFMTMPATGGPPTIRATGVQSFRLAVDDSDLYFVVSESSDTTKGAVKKMPLAGGAPITLASGQAPQETALVVDATHVYWTSFADGHGVVMKVPKEGGTAVTLATVQAWPRYLTVDATSAYWTTPGLPGGPVDGGAVMKAPLAGGGPTTVLAAKQWAPGPIAVNGTKLYWLNEYFEGKLVTLDADPCRNGVCL